MMTPQVKVNMIVTSNGRNKRHNRSCRPQTLVPKILVLLSVLILLVSPSHCQGIDDVESDEYVRQVLEEENQHYYGDNDYTMYQEYVSDEIPNENFNDDAQRQQQEQQDAAERIRMEEERIAKEKADKLAAQREKQFQAELERMNEQQRKVALKSKRRDKRRVQAILRAASNNDLYGILGLRNWNLKTKEIQFRIPFLTTSSSWNGFTIPSISIKETTDKDIRRQFRKLSKQVHPDKNKDGRATEAFIAVEEAAAILSDPNQRVVYDRELKQRRDERFDSGKQLVTSTVTSVWQVSSQTIKTTHAVLGPFATPVFIIAFIIA